MKKDEQVVSTPDWWKEWLENWPAPESRAADGRLRYGKEGARRAVETILAALKVPMAEITPAALHGAAKAAGIGSQHHEPLVLTRGFLLWCQEKGHIPWWVKIRGVKQATARVRPAQAPHSSNMALAGQVQSWARQASPRRRPFIRAVVNAVQVLSGKEICPETIDRTLIDLGYSERYQENVAAALRDFLCWAQGQRLIPEGRLRKTAPLALRQRKLPPTLSREVEGVLQRYYGRRRKGPICEDTKELLRTEFERFYNVLTLQLSPGLNPTHLCDVFPKKRPFQFLEGYRDYLQTQDNPYNQQRLPEGTCRKKMIYLIMLINRANEQGLSGVPFVHERDFPLPEPTTEQVPCLLPEEESVKLGTVDENLIEDLQEPSQFRRLRDALMVAAHAACAGRAEDVVRLTREVVRFDDEEGGSVPFDIISGKWRNYHEKEEFMFPRRMIPLLRRYLAAADEYVAERGLRIEPLKDRKFPSRILGIPLFFNLKASRGRLVVCGMNPRSYPKIFRRHLRAVGVDARYLAFPPKCVRHTQITEFLEQQPSPTLKQIRTYTRHRDVETTLEHYAHVRKNASLTFNNREKHDAYRMTVTTAKPLNKPADKPAEAAGTVNSGAGGFMLASEVARKLGIEYHRINYAIRTRKLPLHPFGGRQLVCLAEAKELFLDTVALAQASRGLNHERRPSSIYRDVQGERVQVKAFGRQKRISLADLGRMKIQQGEREMLFGASVPRSGGSGG